MHHPARTLAVLLAGALFLSPQSFADQPQDLRLTPAQIAADIQLAQETYERLHPGYARYTPQEELAVQWQAIVDKAHRENGLTLGQLYLDVNRVLTDIHCDHTKAELPASMSEERDTRPVYLPARIDLVEGRGFVRGSHADSGLQAQDEITHIDGRALSEWVDAVAPFVPYDGHTVWSRTSGLTESFEFKGGAIDHFGALLFDIDATARLKLRRRNGAQGDWQTLELDVQRITHPEWLAITSSANPAFDGIPADAAANFKDAVHLARVDEHTAYLRVDTFVNYRTPVDPAAVYEPVFKQLELMGAGTLILDLRNNGGGSNDAQRGLMAHFITEKTRVFNDMRVATLNLDGLREHLWTWEKRALKPNRLGFRKNDDDTYSLRRFVSDDLDPVKPAKPRFAGRLIALTSHTNSSGVTNLLSVLKGRANMITVGEKTGGSSEGPTAGVLFTLTLPESGIRTRVPFFRMYNNVTEFTPGLGLTPDIPATQTVTDYLNGVDTTLKTAIDIARDHADDD